MTPAARIAIQQDKLDHHIRWEAIHRENGKHHPADFHKERARCAKAEIARLEGGEG